MTLPISTTNLTGFFIMVSGLSFVKASTIARRMISASKSDLCFFGICSYLKCPSGVHQQVLENRAERERRKECERADDHNHPNQQHGEKRRVYWEGPRRSRHHFLFRKISRDRKHRHDHQKTANQHVHAERQVVPVRIRVESGKG